MDLSRRQFIIVSAAAVAVGCDRTDKPIAAAPTSQPATTQSDSASVVDVGQMSQFNGDKVYDEFRDQGVFIIRRDRKVFGLSSICTHKGCKVRPQQDQSFLCKCHGSTFDRDGHVTKGPATRDLPHLPLATDPTGHLLVKKLQA